MRDSNIISVSNNSLSRAKNSISIVNKIIEDISLFQFDKWEWWNNLSDEWKLILFYEGEIKKYDGHSIQSFNIEINETDLNRILEMKSIILGVCVVKLFKNFLELTLSLEDLSPLNNLNKLTTIYLTNEVLLGLLLTSGKISDITHLFIRNISDLTPLKSFINLKYLSLNFSVYKERGVIREYTPPVLLNVKNLEHLDLNPLSKLIELEGLDLTQSRVSDLLKLEGLINLTTLHLDKNQISDLTPLSNLVNLTTLHLGKNQISDISPISNLVNLTMLHLCKNQISILTPLANLKNLGYLCLVTNKILDLTPLSNLVNLYTLHLVGNQISDLTALSNLINLTYLSISKNKILNTSQIEKLRTTISNCKIEVE